MCFSATASFSAGAFLLGLGTLTLKSARHPRELPFAAIPLLFAIQQLSEGVIWLTFSYEAPQVNSVMTHVYSFFSHVLWPVYVPVAVLLIEPPGWRRRALLVFVATGVAVGAYLLYILFAYPVVSRPTEQHIEYLSPHFFALAAMTLYLMSITFSLFLSTHRTVRVFGVLALSSFAAAYFFYATWFISVWCFFAALLSAVVYLHFVLRKAERRAGNPGDGQGVCGAGKPARQQESSRVRVNTEGTAGVSVSTMAALMVAVFTVSVGFGVVLPLLPYLIERLLGAGGEAAQVSRHTGLLTAVYTLSLFLFAPVWGRLSDRRGPRGVLLVGLLGFGVTMLVFSFVERLAAVYAERFLSGMFAAAVTPVAAAVVGSFTTTEQGRARRLAFVSMAGIAGFLLGPMLGVVVTRFAGDFFNLALPAGSIAIPLAATALLAVLVAAAVAFAVPSGKGRDRSHKTTATSGDKNAWLVPKLLILTFIVSVGVGVFEVGLALRGKQELGLSPYQIALMFTECSLVMFAMQAIVFSPWFKPEATRWLIAPALTVLAAGLFLVPWASDFTLMLAVIGAVAASAGILSPILTYWISAKAGSAQGWELGKQTAAASLGVTLGAAAGGLLFNVAALPGASFVLTAGLAVLGLLLSLGLPHLLVLRNPCSRPVSA